MSSVPGVKRAMELASRVREAIASFGEREAEIEKDRRGRSYAAKRRFEEARDEEESRLGGAVEAVEAGSQAAMTGVEEWFAARSARIRSAHASSKRRLGVQVEEAKARKISELQMAALGARESNREALAAAEAGFAARREELSGKRNEHEGLRRKACGEMRGFWRMGRMWSAKQNGGAGEELASGTAEDLAGRMDEATNTLEAAIKRFRGHGLPRLLRFLPPWLFLVLGGAGGVMAAMMMGDSGLAIGGGVFGGVVVLVIFLQLLGAKGADSDAQAVVEAWRKAETLRKACGVAEQAAFKQAAARLSHEPENLSVEDRHRAAEEAAARMRQDGEERIEAQYQRLVAKAEELYRRRMQPLRPARDDEATALADASESRVAELQAACDGELAQIEAEYKQNRQQLEADWKAAMDPLVAGKQELDTALAPLTPAWDRRYLDKWEPAPEIVNRARFGQLEVDVAGLAEEAGLTLPSAGEMRIPLSLALPREGSLVIETNGDGHDLAVGTLNNIILRLLATSPPGKINFTIIDPVGLGENFAGVMHLADYEDSLINGRIWTQRGQIEEKLAELNEHIEKVIQMYLRNEYETITEYNEQAGNIAEKYHFLVIADFPSTFSETAAKRLQSIASSGPRCGIYTLIHWDRRQAAPQEFVPESLRENSTRLRVEDGKLVIGEAAVPGVEVVLDTPPAPEIAIDFIQKIGKSSTDSNRVEVPFAHVAPEGAERWTNETTTELRVPIGRTGATKLQYLAIGKGTRQHALFAGKTGSGKSTLFHVIITNLSLWCSPEDVEFYLVDFKKGVEFKCYATHRLPHARVIAIESDREFGLSVLQRVDEELKRRGDMFRKLGVQDIAGYKKAGGTEPVPRTLLIIDEFQEIFVEDDRIAQSASVLLDRIVRQGRAFGIHVLLGSQTLGGAYTLARTTLGQMVIRVALQCNEADAYLIMDDSNPAPRLLTRPGEGIYNDAAGALEANSPFQVVWLPDEERDECLDTVAEVARERGYSGPAPIVFEGNAPADVRENAALHALLEAGELTPSPAPKAWLGAPNSIKGPTEAPFYRQGGNNLLVVGQRDEAALAMTGIGLVSLAAQHAVDGAKFIVLDGTPPGSAESRFLEAVVEALPQEARLAKNHDVPEIMNELAEELKRRTADEQAAVEAPAIYLVIEHLQKFKKLRHEDDFDFSFDESQTVNPGAQFNDLVAEGASHGIHIVASVDTYNNVNRFLSRKALSEFEMRIVFQMSANDSAALVDSPVASTLGLHRALFYNEHQGYLETFRPYALPGSDWIEEAAKKLKRMAEGATA